MRLGITLNRIGNAWQVTHLPSVPLADQLADFKAKQVAGGFTADETLVVSLSDTLKRHAKKASAPEPVVEGEESPKAKKKS
ncbi:MAG: hypothetical protein KGR46_07400 [Verrucomicrobia bacterium]|nr:hypothetical protein [Verrucomicrobiota bacterium]